MIGVPGQLPIPLPGRPRLLDGFCGAGGCAVGYARAGWDVTGVDVMVQPRFPLMQIVQADMLDVLADAAFVRSFEAVHVSPPCEPYSLRMRHLAGAYPRLIEPCRARLLELGVPYVIENVVGAPLIDPVLICGTGLGLPVWRHRLFESNVPLTRVLCDGGALDRHTRPALNPHAQSGRDAIYREHGRGDPEPLWLRAMGVGWMDRHEGREAVPPGYTEHVGRQLLERLGYNSAPPASKEAGGA